MQEVGFIYPALNNNHNNNAENKNKQFRKKCQEKNNNNAYIERTKTGIKAAGKGLKNHQFMRGKLECVHTAD